jgi:hypothetical protein
MKTPCDKILSNSLIDKYLMCSYVCWALCWGLGIKTLNKTVRNPGFCGLILGIDNFQLASDIGICGILPQGYLAFPIKGSNALKIRAARHWWFMPIILATWEAEIGRIMVRGQPRQIV